MSDDAMVDAAAPGADAPAPAPIENTAPANDDAAMDAALDSVLGGAKEAQPAQPAGVDAQDKATETPQAAPAPTQQPNLSDEERELAKRFHVPESVLSLVKEEDRKGFLGHLQERQTVQAQLYRKAQELEARLAQFEQTQQGHPQQQSQPNAQQPQEDEQLWAAVNETFGDEFAKPLKQAFSTSLAKAVQPLQAELQAARRANQQAQEMLYQFHYEQGINEAKKLLGDDIPLEGKKGEANLQKLMQEAQTLLNANFNPRTFNLQHALAKAASLTFQKELQLAERKRLAQSQQRALQGSPDAGGLPARTAPPKTEDELYDNVLDLMNEQGLTGKELEAKTRKLIAATR